MHYQPYFKKEITIDFKRYQNELNDKYNEGLNKNHDDIKKQIEEVLRVEVEKAILREKDDISRNLRYKLFSDHKVTAEFFDKFISSIIDLVNDKDRLKKFKERNNIK